MQDPLEPLVARAITRSYGKRMALEATDLAIAPGDILGLVGPNGAGKTTLLKIVAGFLRPDSGMLRVYGADPFLEQAQVMRRARFAFAPPALFDELSPREHLLYLSRLGLDSHSGVENRDIDRVLDQVGLAARARDRVGTFSFGMRQRLVLALALLPMPGLLVLDEPCDGLDPLGVLSLRHLLLELQSEHGVAILLSSHLLTEIEELADRLLVLSAGRTLFYGTPSELTFGLQSLRLRVSDLNAGQAVFEKHGVQVHRLPDELELPAACMDAAEAAQLLAASGLRLLEFHRHAPNLEAALVDRMQRGLQA